MFSPPPLSPGWTRLWKPTCSWHSWSCPPVNVYFAKIETHFSSSFVFLIKNWQLCLGMMRRNFGKLQPFRRRFFRTRVCFIWMIVQPSDCRNGVNLICLFKVQSLFQEDLFIKHCQRHNGPRVLTLLLELSLQLNRRPLALVPNLVNSMWFHLY